MADIGVAYTALKHAFDITKGLKDINDQVKLNTAIAELQQQILDAQRATTEARDQIRKLEDEIAAFNRWEETASRYKLTDYGGNTYAYELKQDRAGGDPIHRICPNCFQKRIPSILQSSGGKHITQQDKYSCKTCKAEFLFGVAIPYKIKRQIGTIA